MLSQNIKELVNIHHLDFGEWEIAKNIIVMVLSDNVFCISFESAVYKLVIVRIGCDEMQMVINEPSWY